MYASLVVFVGVVMCVWRILCDVTSSVITVRLSYYGQCSFDSSDLTHVTISIDDCIVLLLHSIPRCVECEEVLLFPRHRADYEHIV